MDDRETIARLREALRRIRDAGGAVCPDFATCEHVACYSSYGAYLLADAVLNAVAVEGANEERKADDVR